VRSLAISSVSFSCHELLLDFQVNGIASLFRSDLSTGNKKKAIESLIKSAKLFNSGLA